MACCQLLVPEKLCIFQTEMCGIKIGRIYFGCHKLHILSTKQVCANQTNISIFVFDNDKKHRRNFVNYVSRFNHYLTQMPTYINVLEYSIGINKIRLRLI